MQCTIKSQFCMCFDHSILIPNHIHPNSTTINPPLHNANSASIYYSTHSIRRSTQLDDFRRDQHHQQHRCSINSTTMDGRARHFFNNQAYRQRIATASNSAPALDVQINQMMAQQQVAIRVLQQQLRDLQSEPQEGFTITCNDANLFRWDVGIYGPPNTLYQGGYFKAQLIFPYDYPNQPPKMRFTPALFHPNVYKNGDVCVSILHPPGDDPRSGETASERWNPSQSVRTVLLSVISLLNDPNTCSPANVDASISFRNYKEHGNQQYPVIVSQQVDESKESAREAGVRVPETVADYVVKTDKDDFAAVTAAGNSDDEGPTSSSSDNSNAEDAHRQPRGTPPLINSVALTARENSNEDVRLPD